MASICRRHIALEFIPAGEDLDPLAIVAVATMLGRNVRSRRELRGWTNAELARRSKLTRSQVSWIEHASRRNWVCGRPALPDLVTLTKVAQALGCDLGEMLPTRAEISAKVALLRQVATEVTGQ